MAQERFDPRLWIRNIKQWQANGIYLIPAKLRALYQALCHEKQAPLPEIRTILSGSQSLGKEEVAQLKQFFTEAEITLYYGASELSYVTYIRDTQMNDDKTRIGRPFPGIDVPAGRRKAYGKYEMGCDRNRKRSKLQETMPIWMRKVIFVLMAERMIFAVLMARRSPVSV